ncbi:ribonuclease P protein component [Kordiimonas pumila]|uniref:Ribonuclease P protein component n=1 Tax=Kordiimonas pumila TaxID=2161677 RepID=A0ABV7D6G2_9PROT|nr:ribonuclease P protein component [Kordiimonas pumila]
MVQKDKTLTRLTKRPEYLAVAATRRKWVTPSFILQAKPAASDSQPRTGYTVSKKVGNAVIRSKARRRLKEASRTIMAANGQPGWEYVFVGRQAAFDYPFEKMKADIKWALAKLASNADLQKANAAKTADKPQMNKGQR